MTEPLFEGELGLTDETGGIDLAVVPELVSAPPPSEIAPEGGFPTTLARQEGFFNFDDLTATDRGDSYLGKPIYTQLADLVRKDGDDLLQTDLRVGKLLGRDKKNIKTQDNMINNFGGLLRRLPPAEQRLRLGQVIGHYALPFDVEENLLHHFREVQRRPPDPNDISDRVSLRRFIGYDSLARRTIPRFYDLLGRGIRGKMSQRNIDADRIELANMEEAGFDPDDLEEQFDPERNRARAEKLQIDKVKSLKTRLMDR